VFFFAAGAVMIRTGAISRALGFASVVLAALSVLAAGSLAQSEACSVHDGLGFVTPILLYIWLLTASVLLLRRPATRTVARRAE
jgi:hypothetical protein